MFKAIIFDLDGVIFDGEPIQSKSLEMLIRKYGKDPIFGKHGLIHPVGPAGDDVYIEIMKKHNIEDDIENFRTKRREIYVKLLKTKLKPLPGFLDLTKILRKAGLRMALASNRITEHVLIIIKNLGVQEYFDEITGPSNSIRRKPAPDIFLDAAKSLGIHPKYCLVLEDSETGVEAAYQAKMKVIAIPNKFTKHQDFSKADRVVGSLRDINPELIEKVFIKKSASFLI